MNSEIAGLERLLAAAQVIPSYDDVHGTKRTADPQTLRGVLGALGFDASTAAAAECAVSAHETALLSTALEPVYVFAVREESREDELGESREDELSEDESRERPPVAGHRITLTHTTAQREEVVAWEASLEDEILQGGTGATPRGGAISHGGTSATFLEETSATPRRGTGATADRGTFRLDSLPLVGHASAAGVTYERRSFVLPMTLGIGYHRLALRGTTLEANTILIVAPPACYLPDALERRGVWGLAVQLYALRSERNWGIGDFSDLRALCGIVARAGGAAVGLNPLHEVRFETGGVPSPYSPSSRSHANWIYLDIEQLPGYEPSDVATADIVSVRNSSHVDHGAVARLKRPAARAAFVRFKSSAASEQTAFDAFVRRGGATLRRAAIFDALATHFTASGGFGDWATWPEPFRVPQSAEVTAFAREHADDVAFFNYLQWQVDEQLARCASATGMPVGLYRDLAVGADLAGSDTWAQQGTLTRKLAVGAPPDILNTRGQNWGVAPFHPLALRQTAYEPFAELLRANMRHAGALRIDHVMALARLWLVPEGVAPDRGAYVAYRLDEMLAVAALESVRARCMVIGEDLGTVPAGFRETLARRRILSYRLLQFEVDDAGFLAPAQYPALALVSTGTHDLPPVGAYWTESDVTLRARLSLVDEAGEGRERSERARRREQLLQSFDSELGRDHERSARFREAAADPNDRQTLSEIGVAANRYLARSPGRLLMVQLEDLLGDVAQINVPTTRDEYPNWRQRASIVLEDLERDARFIAMAEALSHERGEPSRGDGNGNEKKKENEGKNETAGFIESPEGTPAVDSPSR
jgi:4-alpha-glucanotransferase